MIDTLRADHLGAYGYPRPTSPTIDRLAADGTLFLDVTAATSWTRPSIASLFTSRLPSEHGIVSSLSELEASLPTLAEMLAQAGYRTLGVSGNFPHLNDQSGLTRGFQDFVSVALPANSPRDDTLMRIELIPGAQPSPLRAPTAGELNSRVFEALPEASAGPLFLYVHYMDPHSGYLAPLRFRRSFGSVRGAGPAATSDYMVELASGRTPAPEGERERLINLYDAEIAYVDTQLGRLLNELRVRGFAQDAVIVVLSDHGEEFQDHGGWFHGMTLHRELLRVPLVFHDGRGLLPRGLRSQPVELLDVAPTLLALAGAAADPEMRGRSLFESASADDATPRSRIAELHPDSLREQVAGDRRHAVAVTSWPWKALVGRDGTVALYDLSSDPAEQHPRSAEDGGVPPELLAQASELARVVGSTSTEVGTVTEAEREALRALGYAE